MFHRRRKDELTPATICLILGEFTLLRQWFKGCLNLQWTQMFSIYIQELFSIGESCGYPTLWNCVGLIILRRFLCVRSVQSNWLPLQTEARNKVLVFLKEEYV